MTADAHIALQQLIAGNERFRNSQSIRENYTLEQLKTIASVQKPIAAIVACSDSRVAPEIVFDQPLGTVFAARTPGNVCADSVKWMIDIAVEELHVPLLLVMGHTGCLAVTQIVEGNLTGPGVTLRRQIDQSMRRAKSKNPEDLQYATTVENVYQTIRKLREGTYELKRAQDSGLTTILGSIYHMETGKVDILEDRERII